MAIKQSIKNNIVSANNKYNLPLEKIATIVSKDNASKYSISVVGSDGIKSLYEDISIRYDGSDPLTKTEPEIGDHVYVKEDNGRFTITGLATNNQNTSTVSDIYTNITNGAFGSLIQ